MNRCPITYELCENKYSRRGLQTIQAGLDDLKDLPTSKELLIEAANKAPKMSIQGVQPKLSAVLDIRTQSFKIVDYGGTFIIKPQNPAYDQLPENEDLTMRLAKQAGIDVPLHGLAYCADGSMAYFIKRFDRTGKKGKLPQEDFAQLAGKSRTTKYQYSMEKVIELIETYTTFPVIEKTKLLRIVIFNFLTGNEDNHLKNYSILTKNNKIALSPAYDLINTTIAIPSAREEIALPIKGKKSNLDKDIILNYFAKERMNLPGKIIDTVLENFQAVKISQMHELINISFLSEPLKNKYHELVDNRAKILLP